MSEIVFILGAGASREAGAPLMLDFLDKADQLRKSGRVNEFKPHFDRVFDAIYQLRAIMRRRTWTLITSNPFLLPLRWGN